MPAAPPDPAIPTNWMRGFQSLMVTRFQGAFSDNALKQLVIFLVMAHNWPEEQMESLVSKSGMLFAIPFLVFSMLGGWMADRFSKRSVMIGVKTAELGIMSFATFALWRESIPMQLGAICAMGAHSAFFAASKYGSLPELVPTPRLSWANGIVEMLTFLAAILGTLAAGWMAEQWTHDGHYAGFLLIGLALVGFLSSLGITRVPAANPNKPLRLNFFAELLAEFRYMRTDRDLWRANLGNTAFFFIAFITQMNLLLYAKTVYQLAAHETAWLNAALALGIGAGSLLSGVLSRGHVEYGLVPLGAWLLAAMGLVLGWPGISQTAFTVALVFLGIGGGMFIVPLAAVLQHRPAADRKGSVQGAASWLSWVGICLASVLQGVLGVQLAWSPGQIFWFTGACALVAGIYIHVSRPAAVSTFLATLFRNGKAS